MRNVWIIKCIHDQEDVNINLLYSLSCLMKFDLISFSFKIRLTKPRYLLFKGSKLFSYVHLQNLVPFISTFSLLSTFFNGTITFYFHISTRSYCLYRNNIFSHGRHCFSSNITFCHEETPREKLSSLVFLSIMYVLKSNLFVN